MKTKIFGFALMLSLAAVLGACDTGTNDPAGTPPATTPAPGEPTDGVTPAPTPATP